MGENSKRFPHPAYAQHVLEPAYRHAVAHLYEPMLAANRAQAVMLTRQGIISAENGAALIQAIDQIEDEGIAALPLKRGVEDLFFVVEGRIIELAGVEFGGNLQLARSRNDLGHLLNRMALRPVLLDGMERLNRLRATVLALAMEHLDTLMPGYTHTQPAQPVTFAHYLAGVLTFLQRDARRWRQAYVTTNESPLGAAAFTGTGFPIDRRFSAEILAFDNIIVSSQDAIGTSDHLIDIANALTGLAVNLSRMSHDLLFRATRESGAIRIDDSFIQISSIMPQKRNPVVLEHLRARLSRLLGQAQTLVTQCHNIPYGDTQDIEDEIEVTLFGSLETALDILELYETVFATLSLNMGYLEAQAAAGFTTVTELADALVREHKLPFRSAHHIVSRLVNRALAEGLDTAAVTDEMLIEISAEVLGTPLSVAPGFVQSALDARSFVQQRQTEGGVGAEPTANLLNELATVIEKDSVWHQKMTQTLKAADKMLRQLTQHL